MLSELPRRKDIRCAIAPGNNQHLFLFRPQNKYLSLFRFRERGDTATLRDRPQKCCMIEAVELLEDTETSNQTTSDPSFETAKNIFLKMVKVRVLEGQEKGKIGWVSVATIRTERRLISEE